MKYLSIEEISRQTGLEVSLLRYYESEYPETLPPKVVKGDSLVFSQDAVAIFKKIHMGSSGTTKDETPARPKRYARVIAVTSGKGGVGKTNICLNLAVEFQRLGKMTVVFDADMGMANVHLLAGVNPDYSVREVLDGRREITDIIVPGPEGTGIIPGGTGILTLADSSGEERMRLISALEKVESVSDIVLVDTGAGMGAAVRDFLMTADEIVFVLTPDITSMADAYGLLKALHREKMPRIPVYSVVNMVQTVSQAVDVARRFSGCVAQFLERDVENVGYIMKDSTVGAATARRTPFTVFRPDARASRNMHHIAMTMLAGEKGETRGHSAFRRYLQSVRNISAPGKAGGRAG